MESIPIGYLALIYVIMALPFILAVLCATSLIVVAVLYFTNRRKLALKILRVLGIAIIILVVFTWLTKSSLGI